MDRSSPILGIRQSQCPAKHDAALPPVTRPFRFCRKSLYNVPVGSVEGTLSLQVYLLFTSWCGSGGQERSPIEQIMGTDGSNFFSHISPVWLSVTVKSPLST
jgi:hypothetical protein